MRQSRFPVQWFFVFTYVLTVVGQGVNLYVLHRLSTGTLYKEAAIAIRQLLEEADAADKSSEHFAKYAVSL